MKVALVADTHLPRFGRALPRALVDGFERVGIDRIVHAGDWTDPVAVDLLEALAPVDGVAGNNDAPALHERYGTRLILDLGGARIGVTHGHLGPGSTTPERARRAFEGERLDAIVFGHSHVPLVERQAGGTWLVNPGSPTDKRRQATFSWAVLEVSGRTIASVSLVRYEDRSA
ncbi:MAG TPA: metallophosphoesterase [Candidatus Limnocylindrales bacterium]|nr:metallophosphoesterase [Candidatus Limnocylindrales bacterium]